MLLVLVASLIMLTIAVVLLSVKVIFKKNGRFPSTHVGGNKEMTKRGISCHTSQHADAQRHKNLAERIHQS